MKPITVTKVIFSNITNKWYLQINKLQEIEISETNAKELIKYYGMDEINLNQWELLYY